MNEKLEKYLDGVFAPYDGVKSVAELKVDLLADLRERYRELKAGGMDDDAAFAATIESIGDIEVTVQEVANLGRSLERQVLTTFRASNLPDTDFAGVTAHNGTFTASMLHGSDFSGADLTGSAFKVSDMREVNFEGANLTDCVFSTLDLADSRFNKSVLVRTEFSKSGLQRARFADVHLIDVRFTMSDLKEAVFERCTFTGVDFTYSDLRGQCLDGMTFIGVRFDKAAMSDATFRGATLKNVSFVPAFALTNKNYRAIRTIIFEGATMDKLTYAALKGMGADVSGVTVN